MNLHRVALLAVAVISCFRISKASADGYQPSRRDYIQAQVLILLAALTMASNT